MNIKIDATGLEKIRIAMGADLITHSNTDWASTVPNDMIEALVTAGVDVSFEKDVSVCPDGTLEFLGQKILLYIRDQFSYKYKFHFVDCKTLESMRMKNSYGRYVVTERTDGLFVVNRETDKGEKIRMEDKLDVCINCLKEFNYNNYNDIGQYEQRMVLSNFNIEDFFSFCNETGIMSSLLRPKYSDITAPIDEYPKDWNAISNERKRIKSFRCEKCRLSLANDKPFLHVHHIDHCRYNNSPNNLQVLCIRCHSQQAGTGHNMLMRTKEFAEFQRKYGLADLGYKWH